MTQNDATPKFCRLLVPEGVAREPVRQALRWTSSEGEHIDVRGLAPPAPLVAIVALIDAIDDQCAVIVHHDRDPVLLYPELAERGWVAQKIPADAGEVRLRLHRYC